MKLIGQIREYLARVRANRIARLNWHREVVVTFDEGWITVAHPNGECHAIAWSSLDSVEIDTTDTGPWDVDLWWILKGAESEVYCPNGCQGEDALSAELSRRLPGFSDELVKEAMRLAKTKKFVCWKRPADKSSL